MGRANPRKAVAAAMPLPAVAAPGVVVKPMTLAMWAALERIDSPMLPGREPKDALDLLPSLYLLTHGAEEIFRGNLTALAMAWADTVPVETLEAVRLAAARQLKVVADVIPEDDDEPGKPKKKRTDRSPRSSYSDAKGLDGRTMSASTASRSRRSRSSTGETRSNPAKSTRSR